MASARETSTATAGSTCSRPRAGSRPPPIPRTGRGPGIPTGSSARPASRSWPATSMATGLSDVVYGMGHDYGLFWLHQGKGTGGERTWTKQRDRQLGRLGSYAALGRHRRRRQGQRAGHRQAGLRPRDRAGRDRRLAGRLVCVRPERQELGQARRSSRASRPRMPPPKGGDRLALKDFPPGTAGTGLQMTAIDIDRDGDLDLVCPGKSGLYLFENLRSAERPEAERTPNSLPGSHEEPYQPLIPWLAVVRPCARHAAVRRRDPVRRSVVGVVSRSAASS